MAADAGSQRGEELPTDRLNPAELPRPPLRHRAPEPEAPASSSVRQGLLRDLEKDSGRFSPLVPSDGPEGPDEHEPDDAFAIGVLDTSVLSSPAEPVERQDPLNIPSSERETGRLPPPAPSSVSATQSAIVKEGRRFGPFLLLKRLAGGAMGAVYQAVWEPKGRLVALKLVPEEFSSTRRERFIQEIQALSKLSHPNIVGVATTGTVKGRFFCAMEYLAARSFDRLLALPWFPLLEKVRILSQVAKGLHYAHGQAIIHRDVKPENILVSEDRACLADFGLARDQEDNQLLTQHGTVLGTPLYMAPEQAGGGKVGPEADIYALGAILYEILTGQPPHNLELVHDVMYAAIHREPLPPRVRNPRAPERLEQICLRALSKNPAARQGSAGQLADDLDTWARTAEEAPDPADLHRQAVRRAFGMGALAAAAGAGLLLAAAWALGFLA